MKVVDQATHWRDVGGALLGRGLLIAAHGAFGRWLAVEEASGDPERMIRPLNALATVDIRRKEYAQALHWLLRAEALGTGPKVDVDQHLRIRHNLLVCYAEQNDVAAASREAERIQPILERSGDAILAAKTWSMLAYVYGKLRGEWRMAARAAQIGLDINRALGTEGVGLCLLNLGVAQAFLGETPAAEDSLRSAIAEFRNTGDQALSAYAHTELGWIAFHKGNYSDALDEGQAALHLLLRQVNAADKEEVARTSWLFGSVFAAVGERNAALKYLNRAAAYFAQSGSHANWQEVSRGIGEVLSKPLRPAPGSPPRPPLKPLDQLTGMLDLIDDLESVAPHMRGHTERVAALSLVLGQAVGVSAQELSDLHHAALLHDVGQVAIEPELLEKPEAALQECERERVHLHPELGAAMLAAFGFSTAVTTAVRHHHERFDGTGYPNALSGQEIPLLARIISILESYDAMLTQSTPPVTHEEALAAVMRHAGSHFDPMLCQRFADLFQI